MVKVIHKGTGEVRMVGEGYFKNHPKQFELYIEPKKVPKKRVKKVVKKMSDPKVVVEKDTKE